MKYAINDIHDIAKWFLHIEPMTHKKLQKLLYLSYGIYLIQNNKSEHNIEKALFKNNFEAWVHGPVDPYIYSIYKQNGINLLIIENMDSYKFDNDVMKALTLTLSIYGDYTADELENITHNQTPWKKARIGLSPIEASSNPILDIDIFNTFKEEVFNV